MTFACCTRYFCIRNEKNILHTHSEDDYGINQTDKCSENVSGR